jgi:DNA polymerase-1
MALFADGEVTKMGYHIKTDSFVMQHRKQYFSYPFFDVYLAHYLINPDERHYLEYLVEKYLDCLPFGKVETFWNKQGNPLFETTGKLPDNLVNFLCERVDFIWQLAETFSDIIKKQNLHTLLHDVEFPLIEVLATMERNGVYVDTGTLKKIETELKNKLTDIEEKIFLLAGNDSTLLRHANWGQSFLKN